MPRSRDLLPGVAVFCLALLCGCASVAQVRVQNISTLDFTNLSIAGQPYGDIAAGATTDYRSVDLTLGYAALKLTANGRYITGQTLNFRARRFTYRINVEDFDARQLAIQIIRE